MSDETPVPTVPEVPEAQESAAAAGADAESAVAEMSEAVESAVDSMVESAGDAVVSADTAAKSTGAKIADWLPSKDGVKNGLKDVKNVVLYPLCTGVMTGVGFIAGKRLAERYFNGPEPAVM
jgi:hypothetical protein